MSKKAKKLGVKTKNAAVFSEENFEVTKEETISKSFKSDAEDEVEIDKICSTIDSLTLDMFILMQNLMQQKLKIESCMTDGELHLSKSRYIMGHKSVSSLQLPTETNDDIDPSITITEISSDETMFGKPKLEINTREFSISKENEDNIQDPVKWFGVLVPRDIRKAENKYRDAIQCAIECANTQIRLHETCVKIKQLKNLKQDMMKAHED